jgi:hypothetical protein
MRAGQVARGQGRHERELTSEHGGADDAREPLTVRTGLVWIGAPVRAIRALPSCIEIHLTCPRWQRGRKMRDGEIAVYFTPSICRHADCVGRCVPPPTVPTSRDGIVTDM